ncbi:hypothetical protein BJX96DRAFT_171581 [Aspergillus floccosus]
METDTSASSPLAAQYKKPESLSPTSTSYDHQQPKRTTKAYSMVCHIPSIASSSVPFSCSPSSPTSSLPSFPSSPSSAHADTNGAFPAQEIPAEELERYDPFIDDLFAREDSPELGVIFAFSHLFTEPSTPLHHVACMAATPSISDSPGLPVSNMTLWAPLGEAVEQFPEQVDRLVDFIVALQQLPYFREYCNDFWLFYQDPPRSDTDLATKREAWFNMNTFMAKLAERGVQTESLLQHAGRLLQNALETAPWEEYHFSEIEEAEDGLGDEYEEYRDRELERLCDIRHLDGTIAAVAQWIKIQGRALYEMTGPMDLERERLWDGPPGWSKERWEFWRRRFEWVASVTALDRRTKNIARQAAEEMARTAGDA